MIMGTYYIICTVNLLMVDKPTEVVEAELHVCMVISLLATTCMGRKRLRKRCIHEFV